MSEQFEPYSSDKNGGHVMLITFPDNNSRKLFSRKLISDHSSLVIRMARTSPNLTIEESNISNNVRDSINDLASVFSGVVYDDIKLESCDD